VVPECLLDVGLDLLEAQADAAYGRWQGALAIVRSPGAPVDAAKLLKAESKVFKELNDRLTAINQWTAFVRQRYSVILFLR
jgi:hypothetical protein